MKKFLLIPALLLVLTLVLSACTGTELPKETEGDTIPDTIPGTVDTVEDTQAPDTTEETQAPGTTEETKAPDESIVETTEETKAPETAEETKAPEKETKPVETKPVETKPAETEPPADPNQPTLIFTPEDLFTTTGHYDLDDGNGIVLSEDGSYITYTPSGSDPYYSPFGSSPYLDGDRYIVVKYRTNNAPNATMQIYIGDGALDNDNDMVRSEIITDGEWHLAIFDAMKVNEQLVDEITLQEGSAGSYDGSTVAFFRFDMLDMNYILDETGHAYQVTNESGQKIWAREPMGEGAYIDVAYVAFFSTEEGAKVYEYGEDYDDEPEVIEPVVLDTVQNIALNREPTCDNSMECPSDWEDYFFGSAQLTDGKYGEAFTGAEHLGWHAKNDGTGIPSAEVPTEITIDLGNYYRIDTVKLIPMMLYDNVSCFPQDFEIQFSTDGETWTTVKTVTGATYVAGVDEAPVYTFDPIVASHFRLSITKGGVVADDSGQLTGLGEIEIYNALEAFEHDYVADGLVSLYTGGEGTTWEDKIGDNDVTITENDTNYLTADGLYLDSQRYYFSEELYGIITGGSFTVEMAMSDFVSKASGWDTILATVGDSFSIFRTAAIDTLFVKTVGSDLVGASPRPEQTAANDTLQDATISVTYDATTGTATLYVNGVSVGTSTVTPGNLKNMTGETKDDILIEKDGLCIGHTEPNRAFSALFTSVRFYNAALTAEQIAANYAVDAPAAA